MQSTVQSVLNMKELRSTCSNGLDVPCQNTNLPSSRGWSRCL